MKRKNKDLFEIGTVIKTVKGEFELEWDSFVIPIAFTASTTRGDSEEEVRELIIEFAVNLISSMLQSILDSYELLGEGYITFNEAIENLDKFINGACSANLIDLSLEESLMSFYIRASDILFKDDNSTNGDKSKNGKIIKFR